MTLFHTVRRGLLQAVLLAGCVVGHAHAANTLRIASAFDPQTMDPHALALLYHSRVAWQVYDSLVNRDEKYQLEASLALSWQAVSPTTWRFKLRPDVTFHDGAPFTADDAVFSIERALAPPSQRSFQLKGVKSASKVDALTFGETVSDGFDERVDRGLDLRAGKSLLLRDHVNQISLLHEFRFLLVFATTEPTNLYLDPSRGCEPRPPKGARVPAARSVPPTIVLVRR